MDHEMDHEMDLPDVAQECLDYYDDDFSHPHSTQPPRLPLGSYGGPLTTITETPDLQQLHLAPGSHRRSSTLTLPHPSSKMQQLQCDPPSTQQQQATASTPKPTNLLVDFPTYNNGGNEPITSTCILDRENTNYDSRGRCIHHPRNRLRKKKLFFARSNSKSEDDQWIVLMKACPDCCMDVLHAMSSRMELLGGADGNDDDDGDDDVDNDNCGECKKKIATASPGYFDCGDDGWNKTRVDFCNEAAAAVIATLGASTGSSSYSVSSYASTTVSRRQDNGSYSTGSSSIHIHNDSSDNLLHHKPSVLSYCQQVVEDQNQQDAGNNSIVGNSINGHDQCSNGSSSVMKDEPPPTDNTIISRHSKKKYSCQEVDFGGSRNSTGTTTTTTTLTKSNLTQETLSMSSDDESEDSFVNNTRPTTTTTATTTSEDGRSTTLCRDEAPPLVSLYDPSSSSSTTKNQRRQRRSSSKSREKKRADKNKSSSSSNSGSSSSNSATRRRRRRRSHSAPKKTSSSSQKCNSNNKIRSYGQEASRRLATMKNELKII